MLELLFSRSSIHRPISGEESVGLRRSVQFVDEHHLRQIEDEEGEEKGGGRWGKGEGEGEALWQWENGEGFGGRGRGCRWGEVEGRRWVEGEGEK